MSGLAIVAGVAVGAAPARADDPTPAYPDASFPITVGLAGAAVAGSPVDVRLTGSITSDGSANPARYDSELFLFNTAFLATCPVSYQTARGLFIDNPSQGQDLASGSQSLGTGGPFQVDAVYTPGGTGQVTACAYIRYVTDDVDYAQTTFTVDGPAPASPASTASPTPPPAPTPAPVAAPSIVTAPRSIRVSSLVRGFVVGVNASSGAKLSARVQVAGRTVASGTASVGASATSTLRVKGSRGPVRRALGAHRRRRAVLRVTVTPAQGTATTLTRSITLRR